MQPLTNIDTAYNFELLRQAGSFWNTRVQPKQQVLLMLNLCLQNKMFGVLRTIVDQLAGNPGDLDQYVALKFDTHAVFSTGNLLYGWEGASEYYTDADQCNLAYNRRDITYFVIPVTTHIPRCIQASDDLLVLGLDFFVKGAFLFFRQDPRLLFPKGNYVATLAERVDKSTLMSYLLRCKVQHDEASVLQFYRNNQTPDAFRLALAAVAGLTVTHFDQKLLAVRRQGAELVYTFEQETLRTNYPHTPLTADVWYPAGTIIGNGIQFFRDDGTGNKNWWRQVDWKAGMSLSTLTPNFPFLFLEDQNTFVYSAGSDVGSVAGSKLHARIQLSQDFDQEQAYWDWVGQQETASGNYINGMAAAQLVEDTGTNTFTNLVNRYAAANALNAQLGWPTEQPDIESLSNRKLVNALDFFFQAVFQKRGLIILIDHTQICDLTSFYKFLSREMLSGVIPIVLTQGLDLGVESADNGTTITFTDGATFTSNVSLVVNENVVLSSIVYDTPNF